MNKTLMIFAAAASAVCLCGAELFRDGKTDYAIELSTAADATEQYAAQELHDALKKISGAEFPIKRTDQVGAKSIYIGSLKNAEAIRARAKMLKLSPGKTEKLAVYTDKDNLFLAGDTPRGALYAVYSFLRDDLGVRHLWPGEDGEFMPKKTSFTLLGKAWNYTPAFRFREMTPCGMHYHVPTEMWLARNFLNGGSRTHSIRDKGGFYKLDGGHWVSIGKKDFAAHPEYFSKIGGKHVIEGEAGCWSNPEFMDYLVKKHVKMIAERKFELLNTFPADIVPRCQCQGCTANPDVSGRWYLFYEKLIAELRKTYPDLEFAGIAYQEYRAVPRTPVRGLEYVEYCQYNRCYVHKLDDPTCTLNKRSMDELKSWQAKAPMGIYGYEFDVFKTPMYLPFWNMLADEMAIFRQLGLTRMKTELSVSRPKNAKREALHQMAHRVSNYLYAQLAWNPAADVNVLLEDFCNYAYGKGGKAMLDYHQAMAKAWDQLKIHLSYFGANPEGTAGKLITPELVQLAERKFAEALKAAAGDARSTREIELERALFMRWNNLAKVSRSGAMTAIARPAKDFSGAVNLPMTGKCGTARKTSAKLYRTGDALKIQVECFEPDMKNLRKGVAGKDVNLWNDDMIEMFFDSGDGTGYRHLAVNAAGGTFDAILNDKSFSGRWTASTEFKSDRWITNITIPYSDIGPAPKPGEIWNMVLIRNGKPESSGFPRPVYHDMASAAALYFSDKATPERELVWISSPGDNGRKYERSRIALLNSGWNTRHVVGPEGVKNLDLTGAKLILIDNYQNRLPMEFYRDKLIPAVQNGATAVFSCYFWVHELEKQFNDPSYKMKFVENAHSLRKPTWLEPVFAKTPENLTTYLRHTPSGTFVPAVPESWTVLAKQKCKDDSEAPFILGRRLGKGAVILSGDIAANIRLLNNLFAAGSRLAR